MTSIPRTPLGDGLSVARVINGLWQIADLERDGREFDVDQAALAMSPYVDAGLTTFDMADHYGAAEVIAGIFGERAERLTKWTPKPGPVSRGDVREAVERSLERLRTDRIDLLQFHAWMYDDPSWLDALFHLQVATKHGVPMAAVASRAVLDHEAVAAVIVGTRLSKSAHIEDTLRVFELTLDDEDRKTLAKGRSYLKPVPGDCGDEYRKPPYLTASGDLSHHFDSMPPPYPVKPGPKGRTLVLSGTSWEPLAGFSRAHRLDDRIWISGTTATHREKAIGGNDARAQLHFIVDKIEGALRSLGASLDDVVRTRVFVRHVYDWEDVARAHGERFRRVMPANTLVQADLIGDEYLVEVEAEAVVTS